jgi:hypothetical protein
MLWSARFLPTYQSPFATIFDSLPKESPLDISEDVEDEA